MSTPMMRRFAERLTAALLFGVVLSAFSACERDASGLTEWTPADHDHQAEPRQRRTQANLSQKANPHSAPSQKNQVIDVTWQKQCATCHGKRGRGDGPSSTMVKARDLSDPQFQSSVSDDQLKKVIREGKDKMPAFNLPDSIIDGLVEHVRTLARKTKGGAEGEDEGAEASPEPTAGEPQNAPAAVTAAPPPAGTAQGTAPSPGASAPTLSPAAPSPAAPSPAAPAPAAPPSAPPAAPAPAAPPSAPPAHQP
jgi:mono/diheme cytochrome c family protein